MTATAIGALNSPPIQWRKAAGGMTATIASVHMMIGPGRSAQAWVPASVCGPQN